MSVSDSQLGRISRPQLPGRATHEPRQNAQVDASVDGWNMAWSLFYHQCLFLFLRWKLKPHRIKGGKVHVHHQAQCQSMHPCMCPLRRKLEMQAARGPEEPQSMLSYGVCVKKPQIHLGRVPYGEHFWKRAFGGFFFQDTSPLKLNENCFGSQEMVETVFSQMANAKTFKNTVCKSMLWLSYIREVFA